VATRLQRSYAIRDAVLGCIDADKRADLDNIRLVRAISVWITQTEKKDKAGFFKYLRETGMYEESFKVDPSFAWVLVNTVNYDGKVHVDATNKGGVYEATSSSAPGSYSYTWKYLGDGDNYYDPDLLPGENSTSSCIFTVPPSTIKGGEEVTLSLKLSFGSQKLSYYTDKATAGADFEKWDVESGYVLHRVLSSLKTRMGKRALPLILTRLLRYIPLTKPSPPKLQQVVRKGIKLRCVPH